MRIGIDSIVVGGVLAFVLAWSGDARAHGEEGVRVASTAELPSASYPGAQGLLAAFTAEGRPADARLPCLIPAPYFDGGS